MEADAERRTTRRTGMTGKVWRTFPQTHDTRSQDRRTSRLTDGISCQTRNRSRRRRAADHPRRCSPRCLSERSPSPIGADLQRSNLSHAEHRIPASVKFRSVVVAATFGASDSSAGVLGFAPIISGKTHQRRDFEALLAHTSALPGNAEVFIT